MPAAIDESRNFFELELAKPEVDVQRRINGDIILRSPISLAPYPDNIAEYLHKWSKADPTRTFLAERNDAGAWEHLSYAGAAEKADAVSQWLIDYEDAGEQPVATLGDNSIDMAMIKLGAMQIGVPFLPISPAYSLMSENFFKLKHVVDELRPSLIYAPSIASFANSLRALDLKAKGIRVISDAPHPEFPDAILLSDVLSTKPTSNVAARRKAVTPDTIGKILLTSGSTGMPKGVINTHRMMCSNSTAMDQLWIFLEKSPPVMVDWLPWNHTFGSNFNFNQILRNGGSMYIDAGKPVPQKFEQTLRNLRDVQQTVLFNVPRGFDMLLPVLEADRDFGRHVFEKLEMIFYAAAALPPHLWKRIDDLAVRYRGKRIPILSALGSTETAPAATMCHWPAADIGGVGLPVPGCEIKLVPIDSKLEIRVRGANVTPGYYNRADLNAGAFDEEGYFKLGDAVAFIDPNRPDRGLRFDGRISENFKLSSGTWVQVSDLRLSAISAASPVIEDAVVTGHDREHVGLLIFPNLAGCRSICDAPHASSEEIVVNPKIHAHLANTLASLNASNPGSSRRIDRVLLMAAPPSVDGGEITDKGYINQRAVLDGRAALVERLYAENPSPEIVFIPAKPMADLRPVAATV